MEWLLQILKEAGELDWIRTIFLISTAGFYGNITGNTWMRFPKERKIVGSTLSDLQENKNKLVNFFI